MVRESLARKFHPAGFEQPEGSRQNYIKPSPELYEAFYSWLEGLPNVEFDINDCEFDKSEIAKEQYIKALRYIDQIGEIPYREANSLLVDFKPKTKAEKNIGLFISACYNRSPEQVIIFDMNLPEIRGIGYCLEGNRVLINNGEAGLWFGARSYGVVVNNGKTEKGFSWRCYVNGAFCESFSGIAINNGDVGDFFGYKSSGKILISLNGWATCEAPTKTETILHLSSPKLIPNLKQYLEELSEITRNIKDEESARKFIERYGIGGEKIEPEVKDILKKKRI